jgi:hypothetical protein
VTTHRIFLLLLGAAAFGCRTESSVDIHVSLPASDALAGLEVIAAPYDAQAILDSLERAAPTPRPQFPDLDSTLDGFRRDIPDELRRVFQLWADSRGRVEALADTLHGLGHDAPGYERAYNRFRQLYEALVAQEADLERATREMTAEDRELGRAAGLAADSLRRWEEMAFADFDRLADSALARSERSEQYLVTDAAGRVHTKLPVGRWWLLARLPHPENPFMVYSWNAPIHVRGTAPLRVPMSGRNVTLVWRH